MSRLIRINFIVLVLASCIIGCATEGTARRSSLGETPQSLDVAMALKFKDVPIPTGFKLVANESFAFENDSLRVGALKYSGRAQADYVVTFFKDQMPLYNWRFLNLVEYGRRILNFDREDQTCVVVIESGHLNTYVSITVAPKSSKAVLSKANKAEPINN